MSRTGLRTRILHSIKCDEGKKYERYFSISFLPPKPPLDACIAAGCLEVSKTQRDKEFYNPSKFYSTETLEQAVVHMISALAAFRAYLHHLEPHQAFHKTMDRLMELRPRIAELTQAYLRVMRELEEEAEGQ